LHRIWERPARPSTSARDIPKPRYERLPNPAAIRKFKSGVPQPRKARAASAAAGARTDAPPLRADCRRRTCLRGKLRRRHYDIVTDISERHRFRVAFDDLVIMI